jgi:chorismate mutase
MRISREIGLFKKKNAIPVLQTSRYDEIMTNRLSVAETMGLNRDFMKELLEILHEESVKQQIDEIERTTHRSQGE